MYKRQILAYYIFKKHGVGIWLINLFGYFLDAVHCTYGIEMDAGNMVFHQFLALLHAPFDTYLLRFGIILAFQDFVCQLFGQVYLKRFGYHAELRKLLERLDARYNGDGNSGFCLLYTSLLPENEIRAEEFSNRVILYGDEER